MSSNTDSGPERCTCMPYQDALLITAQVLSIVAIFLSWTTLWTLILGLAAFICLQVIWCCRMHICGLITVAVLAAIAGIAAVIAAIVVLVAGSATICENVESNPDYNEYYTEADCRVGVNTYVAVGFISGALWIVASILVSVFSCGDRYKSYYRDNAANTESKAQPVYSSNAGQKADATQEKEEVDVEQQGNDDNNKAQTY